MCVCKLFLGIHWLLLFSVRPPGVEVAGKGNLPELLCKSGEVLGLPGRVWTDSSIPGIPRADSHGPSHRHSKQMTGRVGAFHPAAAEYLLAELAAVLVCSLPLLFLLISDVGDLWMTHGVHMPTSCYCFLNMFIRCVLRRERRKGIVRHPHNLQQLSATRGPAGFWYP